MRRERQGILRRVEGLFVRGNQLEQQRVKTLGAQVILNKQKSTFATLPLDWAP